MGTLQENQSLNAEYERHKKEREMQENIEYLNYCNEQLEKTNKNLNYKIKKLEEDYRITCEQKNQYISTLEQGLNNTEQEIERLKIIEEKYKDSQLYIKDFKDEIERLNNIIKEVREYINNIDEIEVRYLDKEALYRNNITEYQIQEQLKKDKTLEGHFVKVNKYYLLEILDKGE